MGIWGGEKGSVEPVAALMLLAGVRAVVTLSYDCGVVARRGGRIPTTHVTAELQGSPLHLPKKVRECRSKNVTIFSSIVVYGNKP